MKKTFSTILLLLFILGAHSAPCFSAKKTTSSKKATTAAKKKKNVNPPAKKKKKTKKPAKKKYYWPKGGSRPVFPVDSKTAVPPPPANLPQSSQVASKETVPFAENTSDPTLKDVLSGKSQNRLYYLPQVGFKGGTLTLGLGFEGPFNAGTKSFASIDLGFGNNYTVMSIGAKALFPIKNIYFLGAGVDLGNYSNQVQDIFGLSGNVDRGLKLGLAVCAGAEVNNYQLQLGYSSVLGINASAGYRLDI